MTIRLRDAGGLPAGPAPAQVSLLGRDHGRRGDRPDRARRRPGGRGGGRAARWSRSPRPAWSPWRRSPDPAAWPNPGGRRNRGRSRCSRCSPGTGCTARGPRPPGTFPVAVHLSPDRVTLNAPDGAGTHDGADAAARLCLTVACGPGPMAGEVTLDVPPGLTVTGPDGTPAGPLEYSLAERGYARWDLPVAALPGTEAGAVLRVRAYRRRPRPGAGGHGADHRRRAARARPGHAARATGRPAGGRPGGAGSRGGGDHGARRPGDSPRRVRGAGRAAGQPDRQRDPGRVPAHVAVRHLEPGQAVDPRVHRRARRDDHGRTTPWRCPPGRGPAPTGGRWPR